MTSYRSFALFAAGLFSGVAAVVSCGHSPTTADAADLCSCPASEPPLDGRIVQVAVQLTVPASGSQNAVSMCPAGATILGGSCALKVGNPDLVLAQSGIYVEGNATYWNCEWKNPTAASVDAVATAICLKPAP